MCFADYPCKPSGPPGQCRLTKRVRSASHLGPGSILRKVTDQLFASAGIQRTVRFEVHDVDTLLKLVGHGLGSAILAEPNAPVVGGVAFVPLAGRGPPWTLVLVTQEAPRVSRAAAAMFNLARESA